MQEKVGIKIERSQLAKLRRILPRGEIAIWISEAISELLTNIGEDKRSNTSFFSHLKNKKLIHTTSIYCWLSAQELESVVSITNKIKKYDKLFTRTKFAFAAIERKLLLIEENTIFSCEDRSHFAVRIDPKIKEKIKEPNHKRKNKRKQTISHWLAEAAQELLFESSSLNCFLHKEFHLRSPVLTSIAATKDLKDEIKKNVEKIRETNPHFSISMWITEAARRKIYRELIAS